MEAWPASLPPAPIQDFSAAYRVGLADPDETGSPLRTRTYPERAATFSFVLTTEQLHALRAWYRDDLNEFAPWDAPWLSTIGHAHHFCRFLAAPAASRLEVDWLATISVEVMSGVPAGGEYWTNDPVVVSASDDHGFTAPGAAIAGDVLLNDYGVTGVHAVNLETSLVGTAVPGSNGGLFTILADGSWTFDPNGEFAYLGPDESAVTTILYTATDGQTLASATLTVTITRGGLPPFVLPDTAECFREIGATGNVLTNDGDPDGGTLHVSAVNGSATRVGVPVAGSLGGLFTILADGSWTFAPGMDFDGLAVGTNRTSSVQYTASNGTRTATTTLAVTVEAGQTLTPDSYVTDPMTPIIRNVLTNDVGLGDLEVVAVNYDPGLVGIAAPCVNGGTITVHADGWATYDPQLGVLSAATQVSIDGPPVRVTATYTASSGAWSGSTMVTVSVQWLLPANTLTVGRRPILISKQLLKRG